MADSRPVEAGLDHLLLYFGEVLSISPERLAGLFRAKLKAGRLSDRSGVNRLRGLQCAPSTRL